MPDERTSTNSTDAGGRSARGRGREGRSQGGRECVEGEAGGEACALEFGREVPTLHVLSYSRRTFEALQVTSRVKLARGNGF
jgi:hypothetical protein